MCYLLFQKGLRWLLMCAPLLKLDDFFYHGIYVPCHETMLVSCLLGEFSIYWDLKTKILDVSGRREVCNSFGFLQDT